MAELIPVDFDPFAQEKAAGEFVKKKITDLVDFKPVDFNPFVEEFEQERTAGELAYKFIKNKITNLATLPQRAFESSESLRRGEGYDPGPALEAATLPMGPGRIVGVPMRVGETALGSGLIRYKQALERGEITQAEYDEFAKILGTDVVRAQPSGFSDKAAARVELNRSIRAIEKYSDKDSAHWQEGGPALTATERAEWQNAFKRKQAAQQYLDSTQPILIPVDHDPFAGNE